MTILLKRVYQPAEARDGTRILVDRVWPRGFSRERLQAALWLKEAAPTTALRKWFGHDRSRWEEFRRRYFAELDARPAVVNQLLQLAAREHITLLYSAADQKCNQAVALRQYLIAQAERNPSRE